MSKKVETPLRKLANLPHPRLPAPIGQNFKGLSPNFLLYKNGSNLTQRQLNTISINTQRPHKIHFKVISLLYIDQRNGSLEKIIRFFLFWFFVAAFAKTSLSRSVPLFLVKWKNREIDRENVAKIWPCLIVNVNSFFIKPNCNCILV